MLGTDYTSVEMIGAPPVDANNFSRTLGNKHYNLSNHLGNVLAIVSDKKIPRGNGTTIFYNEPEILSAVDYSVGGMLMPGRQFNSTDYRYGYNKGSEKDDEISGAGNHFTTFYREGDTRLLTWWSVDPEADEQPWQSPYSYMDGNPIKNNDPDGDCPTCFLGGLIGAAVDYGTQVAANYAAGEDDIFTDNINLTSIGTAAVAGFLTSGASAIATTGAKLAVTTGAAIINNTVKVSTSKVGIKIDVETNPINIVKNTAIDVVADKLIGKVAPTNTVQKGLSKVGFNKGEVAKTIKDTYKATGNIVNRATNESIKSGAKKVVENTSKKVAAAPIKAATKEPKQAVKKATNVTF